MRVKARLVRIEKSRAATAKQTPPVNSEETRQWLNGLIQSINDGTHIPTPWIIRPVPPGTGPTGMYLHNILNRIAENEQNESKNQTG
jgi:hypothetical protein